MDPNKTFGQIGFNALAIDTEQFISCKSKQLYIFQPWVQVLFIILYVVIFVVGVAGNLLVIAVIVCNKHMRSIINIYILNLSASDILLCLVMWSSPLLLFSSSHCLTAALCKLLLSSLQASVYMSSFTLTAIALERYRAVFHPFSSQTKSLARTALIILCIDLFAIIINLPLILKVEHGEHEWSLYYNNITWYIVQNLIPFTIIVLCYTRIMLRLHTRRRDPRRTESMTMGQRQGEAARTVRLNKMLISMVVIFGVCWFPFNIINLVFVFTRQIGCWDLYFLSFLITHLISKSSACFNPFLYGWLNPEFRTEFRKIFKCRCVLNSATAESKNRQCHRSHGTVSETIEMEEGLSIPSIS